MSFKTTLKIGSLDNIRIRKCDYTFHRDVDTLGKTTSGVYGGTINLTVASTDDTTIIESMVNQYKPIDGTITFKKGDEDAKMKEVTWEKGYIIRFHENFDHEGNEPLLTTFTVSAEKIKIGNAEHNNEWPTK
jgi:hypothetical protein